MRKQLLARIIQAQIRCAQARFWRIVEFSIQATHLHLLVEAENEVELGRAAKGLGVRMARSLNPILGRKGRLVAGPYHAHVLRTPREVRNAIVYVIFNAHKHGVLSSGWDPWSSAAWFEGWSKPLDEQAARYRERVPIPVAKAQTWLLSHGWRQRGLVSSSYGRDAALYLGLTSAQRSNEVRCPPAGVLASWATLDSVHGRPARFAPSY